MEDVLYGDLDDPFFPVEPEEEQEGGETCEVGMTVCTRRLTRANT